MLSLTTLFEFNLNLPEKFSGELATFILLVFFALFSSLEFLLPREKLPKKSLRQSYKTNISLFILNSTLMSLLSVLSLFMLAQRYSGQGLLRYLSNPVGEAMLAFIVLDLLLYLWHKTCHNFDALWLFHRVHHNDPYLNTSTAFRLHVLELFFTSLFKATYIILLGIDQMIVLANETIITVFIMFHHTNITFTGEKWLGRVFIVPYLHRAHHSTERHEHDSNYGAVLSIWDRLFGTLAEIKPEAVGIRGYSPQDFINLVKFGFNMHTPPKPQQLPVALEVMIAEAAYYKAEKRNFHPGNELLDWLEAKREIISLVYGDKSIKKTSPRKQPFNFFGFIKPNMNHALNP
ncbi:MAG: sterol desaturase family protein [Methylococcaceae bacterium]